jgi:hypothetical protein
MFSWGVFIQSTQHLSFYATVGTPEVEDSFVNGIHNVYTGWYTLDSQITALYTFSETVQGSLLWLFFGGSAIYFNSISGGGTFGLIAGIIIVLAGYINVSNLATVMTYAVINSVYIQTRYSIEDYVTIQFGTFANAFGAEGENGWL